MALLAAVLLAGPAGAAPAPASGSRSCLPCHAAEAAPLARSRHGLAAGPGLIGQLPTSGAHRGAALACLLCHAPAADQQPFVADVAPADAGPGRTAIEAASLALATTAVTANANYDPHARDLGVGCVACHGQGADVRGPRADPKAPHAARAWSDDGSATCFGCHQFGPDSAVNGKPPENLVAEWRASRWGQAGASCVSCHVPDGRHLFQGIHDRALVAASVEVRWTEGALALTNAAVGHDFPSYATPRVVLAAQAEDARGQPLGPPAELELSRRLRFLQGAWRELADTRVEPGGTRTLRYVSTPGASRVHATVRVEPDFAYVALDEALLQAGALPEDRRAELQTALAAARGSGYLIFDETRPAPPLP